MSINKAVLRELSGVGGRWLLFLGGCGGGGGVEGLMGTACDRESRPDAIYYGHQIKDLRMLMRNTFLPPVFTCFPLQTSSLQTFFQ